MSCSRYAQHTLCDGAYGRSASEFPRCANCQSRCVLICRFQRQYVCNIREFHARSSRINRILLDKQTVDNSLLIIHHNQVYIYMYIRDKFVTGRISNRIYTSGTRAWA